MHWLDVITVFVALTLVGVEFSVSAFLHPAARRLEPGPQLQLLSRLAMVLGKVMPVWYPVSALLLIVTAWLHRHTAAHTALFAAAALWTLAALASIVCLVPLNSRVAEGAPDWQSIHQTWDQRHRMRIAALAIAALLFSYGLV